MRKLTIQARCIFGEEGQFLLMGLPNARHSGPVKVSWADKQRRAERKHTGPPSLKLPPLSHGP